MSNEDKFKQSLNKLLNQKEFAFEESDWIAASKLIDSRRKKRRFGFYFLSGIVLLGVLAIGFSLSQPTTKKQISTKENTVLTFKETTTISTLNLNSEEASKISDENNTKKIHTYKKNKLDVEKAEESNEQLESTQFTTKNDSSSMPIKTLATNSLTEVTNAITRVPSLTSIQNTTESEEDVRNITNHLISSFTNTDTNTSEHQSDNLTTSNEAIVSNIVLSIDSSTTNNLPAREVESIVAKEQIKQNADSNSLKQNIIKVDSINKTTTAGISDTLNPTNLYASNELFIEAGGLLNIGWKNSNTREALSISPAFGLMFTSRITNQLAFSIGIGYQHISNLNYSNKQSKITRYGIGEYSKVTSITPYQTQFINIPIKLHYSLNKMNVIGVGYHISYLLDVQSRVETYTQQLAEKVDYETYKTGGYTEGFKTFNSQISIFYRRNIYNKFWVQAEFAYGLTDLKDNTFFNTPTFERNSGLKISMLYNLYKK